MLFQTVEFAIFFILVLAGFALLRQTRFWQLWLLLASYLFYGWWNPLFLLLILYVSLFDYTMALAMERRPGRKKLFLCASLVNDLLLLGFFKYADFFAANLRWCFAVLHIPLDVPDPGILLPVGISFFTFQSMSYCIDVYRGELRAEKKPIRYCAFVALFPQLVAGPIERAGNLLRQLRHRPVVRIQDISDGISLFITGLFKKVVVADTLAIYVNRIYESPESYDSWTLAAATFAFAWQIYGDFSGYTDMARGIAGMMGFHFRLNFNNPYTAVDLKDFWQRWHISLSGWFKDYVYIPLGGNRRVKYRVWFNIFITMVISGFWHGAAWNFVIWGALNGAGLLLSNTFDHAKWYLRLPKLSKQLLVFGFISFTWIFFRAESLAAALEIVRRIFSGTDGERLLPLWGFVLAGLIWIYQLWYHSDYAFILHTRVMRMGIFALLILLLLIIPSGAYQQFIYFQF